MEVQRSDKGAGRKRARYNSSMMDANLLKKGEDFDKLLETWVIFITENDVMEKGLPLYSIERCFLGTGERFEDGSHILYVNGAYRSDTPIGKLMHDFSCTDAADMYYRTLAADKYALEEIVNISGLSLEEVKQLKADRST